MRFVRSIPLLAMILISMMVASPLLRHYYWQIKWLNPTHTLIHMDGIALGSLIALGIYSLSLTKNQWMAIGITSAIIGFGAAATIAGGTSLLDSAIALGFAGIVLTAMTTSGARNPINWLLSHGPLAFYGTISYGLYLCHILVFVYFGSFNAHLDEMGIPGHLIILALRLVAATIFGSLLYYGVESQAMKLKRYF